MHSRVKKSCYRAGRFLGRIGRGNGINARKQRAIALRLSIDAAPYLIGTMVRRYLHRSMPECRYAS